MTGWYRDGKCRFLMIIVAIIIVIIINVVVIVIIIITKSATIFKDVRIICFRTDAWDRGSHTVCAEMTNAFLEYTKSMGNDLSTPRWKTVMILKTWPLTGLTMIIMTPGLGGSLD